MPDIDAMYSSHLPFKFRKSIIHSRVNDENPFLATIAYVSDQTGSGISELMFSWSDCCFKWAYIIRNLKTFPFVSVFHENPVFGGHFALSWLNARKFQENIFLDVDNIKSYEMQTRPFVSKLSAKTLCKMNNVQK